MTESLGCTPSQTIGPFLAIVLPWPDGARIVERNTAAAVTVIGRLTDGVGAPVPDGLVEIWQADPEGRFAHADDPRGAVQRAGFRGFGRCPTDETGSFNFYTVKPGPLPDGGGGREAPHLDVSVFARGLLTRVVTRMYFPDEVELNAADPVLALLGPDARRRLIAMPERDGTLRFDIRLQGADETPFFRI